ncbi:MAG: hypothetical protein C0399_12525 [Syntrophus sp. (in: bacteria)]|nr:hypothetical protein [Syntrophus sp. (in: bacteria)]
MRAFDEVEKEIIKEIVFADGHDKSFVNLFNSRKNLERTSIRIDKASKEASFLFQTNTREASEDELKWATERRKQLTVLLLRYVNLFRYLDKEELAIFYNPTIDFQDPVIFGMGAENMDYVTASIDDQYIVDLLLAYVSKHVLASPSLRQLVSNDFLSDEEVRFRSMRNVQRVTIAVAILIGLSGICLNIVNGIFQYRNSVDYRPALKEIASSLDRVSKKIETDTQKTVVGAHVPALSKDRNK